MNPMPIETGTVPAEVGGGNPTGKEAVWASEARRMSSRGKEPTA